MYNSTVIYFRQNQFLRDWKTNYLFVAICMVKKGHYLYIHQEVQWRRTEKIMRVYQVHACNPTGISYKRGYGYKCPRVRYWG